ARAGRDRARGAASIAGERMIADVGGIVIGVVVAAVIYVVVLWLALAFYVMRDAYRRSSSPTFHMTARVLGLVPPFLGPLVYLVLRPPRTLEEQRALATCVVDAAPGTQADVGGAASAGSGRAGALRTAH